MQNKFKRIMSLLLALVMMVSMPIFAMAEDNEDYSISPFSLFPIEEVEATIDLTTYTIDELANLPTSSFVANLKDSSTGETIEIDSAATTVWCNFFDENGDYVSDTWKVLGMDDTVDILSLYLEAGWYDEWEIIIGSGNQLDEANQRFFVEVELPETNATIDLTSYLYPNLYAVSVSELIDNMTVNNEKLTIVSPETTEILWNIKEFNDNNIHVDYANCELANTNWLKLNMRDSIVKFAPQTSDRRLLDIYNWENQTMLIKADGKTNLYNIEVIYPEWNDMFEFNLYTQDENNVRSKVTINDLQEYVSRYYTSSDGEYTDILTINAEVNSSYDELGEYYLGLQPQESLNGFEVVILKGWDNNVDVGLDVDNWDFGEADVTDKFLVEDMTVVDAGVKDKWLNFTESGRLTLLLTNGDILYCEHIRLDFRPSTHSVSLNWGIYADVNNERIDISNYSNSNYIEEEINGNWYYTREYIFSIEKDHSADAEYSIGFEFYDGDTHEWSYDSSKIDKAVVGHFYSLEEATNAEDIKQQLFVENIYEVGAGYKDNFSGDGVDFTFFVGDDVIHYRIIITESEIVGENDGAPDVGSSDRYFQVNDLYNGNEKLDTYVIPYEHDTYYSYGYQTLLINDTEADMTAIAPEVYLGYNAKVYYNGELEEINDDNYYNKLSARDFTVTSADAARDPQGSIRYTVSAENHIDQKNYWITAVKKEEGAKLFVNGPDKREIFLDNYFNNVHDIFVANVGTEELTGITVTLDATNVKLDEYWTIGGEGNDTLAPFDTTSNNTGNWNGELFNVAKIRLIPDGEGEISGTLTITADGQEPRIISLTGMAGNPKIDTTSLHEAVKYVPYSAIITTNNMHDWNKVTFELYDGKLPDGIELYPSGEIYGVPKETGEFPISVRADYSHYEFEPSYVDLVLKVQDNTDENVNATVDEGYKIITRVPDKITSYTDREFEIEGALAEFIDFWLDGEKLEKGVDYTAEEGSTKITIKSQTFSKAGNGKHTISAEFRVDGDRNKDLKKASQNYSKGSSGGTSGGGGGGGISRPSSYKVWFEVNGGAWLDAITVKRDNVIETVPTPERAGYVFDGWYTDKELTQPFDVNTKITANTTLYAKWIELFTIWFEECGGQPLEDITVQNGQTTGELPIPVREGYIFVGWYKDENLTQKYDINESVTASIALFAKWIEDKPPVDASGFIDVTKDDWFYDDVQWAYVNKFMVGYSNVQFAPNDAITGGMVVAVLARLVDVDVNEYADTEFEDVYEGEWYTPYAKWAKAVGLVDGIPFNPPAEITREWMGIVLTRFLDYMKAEFVVTDEMIEFADSDLISDEAMKAMQILFKLEIFKGRGNNVIDPVSNTTRAEFAALIHRVENFLNEK